MLKRLAFDGRTIASLLDQSLAQRCSGRWRLALLEDNLTDHADWRSPVVTLSIALGEDLQPHWHLPRLNHLKL